MPDKTDPQNIANGYDINILRPNKDITITIAAWNLRSLNDYDKIKEITKLNSNIVLLQEIWSPKEEVLDLLKNNICYYRTRSDGYGGTMMLSDNKLKIVGAAHNINKDSDIVKLSSGSDRNIWLSSMYINKKTKKNLLDTLAEVQRIVPVKEWPYLILGGDWNINIRDTKDKVTQTLQLLCKNMGLTIASCGSLHGENEIDFFIHGARVHIIQTGHTAVKGSDHNSPWIKIKVDAPTQSLRHTTVPNRKLADEITQACLDECKDGKEFTEMAKRKYKYNLKKLTKTVRPRKKENELLERITTSEEDQDTLNIVKEYWREKAEECEGDLLNGQLNKAFKYLRTVTKFHEFQRRDGSIITKVRAEDGTIVTDQDEVQKLVLENLRRLQTSETEPQYSEPHPFPNLTPLSTTEMDYILSKIYDGKAIAFDGITDTLFSKDNKSMTAKKLNNIWSADIAQHHFETRTIALNKLHPEIGTAKDCRPIAVCSALIKLVESRSRKTLETYMIEKLHRGQTGFVSGMGIAVNQMRMVNRIKEITSNKRHCFGLFIDFSSAYNTILHTKIYERLMKVLPKEEVDLIKAIYSRIKIILGKHSFTPNIGVAQGSIISPALFNIYSEDLYYTLEKEADIPFGDLMGYADDLLILCTSPNQLRKAIETIKAWSIRNNLLLNAKKSGIVEFLPRAKTYPCALKPGTQFEGIPIVTEYKYLGLITDQKLTLKKQLDFIEEKTNYQCAKLWPVLKAFSLTERMNLWTILARPLFEMLIFPYHAEHSKTNTEKVHTKLRRTFKKFCLFKKTIDNKTIEHLMDYDFVERAQKVAETTKKKWEARINHNLPAKDTHNDEKYSARTPKIWYPKEFVELLNLKTALCPQCNIPCGTDHLKEHQIDVPDNMELIKMVKSKAEELSECKKQSKKQKLDKIGSELNVYINNIKSFLDTPM